jgi:hypothetical protein
LAEAQAWGINPRDNRNELMEFIELRWLLHDVEVDCIIEAGRLATLVSQVSQVLENLGMPPIPRIPRDPHTTSHVMEVVDVILECVKEAYNSIHNPRIRCWEPVAIIAAAAIGIRLAAVSCFSFVLF